MLTGTWLEREKLLAGLFFLLLLLLLLPPPELTVLPPDTFLFRRLLGACLAGSAIRVSSVNGIQYSENCLFKAYFRQMCVFKKYIMKKVGLTVMTRPGGATILCHFWKRQVFRQSLGLKLYVLCLDINSCIGSNITHSFREDNGQNMRVS